MVTAAKRASLLRMRERVRTIVWAHLAARPCKSCGNQICKVDQTSKSGFFLDNGTVVAPSSIISNGPSYLNLDEVLGKMEVQCRYCQRKERGYRSRDYRIKQRIRVKQEIRALCLKSVGCLICKEAEPVALDFHHLDPTKKDGTPFQQHSVKKALEEAAKCVILCANCHRKVHAGLIVLPLTFPTP